jgi:predicted phosphoribosyltransferase
MAEMERRRTAYLQGRPHPDIAGKVAILVDDGLATGATMLAAVRATRRRNPARLIVAVPVAAADSLARIAAEADEVVCLYAPEDFGSVGQHYRHFPQLRDEEVTSLLDQAAAMLARKSSTSGDSGAAGSSANS